MSELDVQQLDNNHEAPKNGKVEIDDKEKIRKLESQVI